MSRIGWFSDIRWVECPLCVRNVEVAQGTMPHPLFVLDAILKYASHAKTGHWPEMTYFRPCGRIPDKLSEGIALSLNLILPGNDALEAGEAALDAIEQYLAAGRSHFELLKRAHPQVFTLDTAVKDALCKYPLLDRQKALCLRFTTPLPYKGTGWNGAINGAILGGIFRARMERLFGEMPKDLRDDAAEAWSLVEVHDLQWTYAEFHHRSRSLSGTRYLNGWRGPLWLVGDMETIFPLLVLGARLSIGKRLQVGQGAFELSPSRPYLDAALCEVRLWRDAWRDLLRQNPALAPDLPEGMAEKLCETVCSDGPPVLPGATADLLLATALHGLLRAPLSRLNRELAEEWTRHPCILPTGNAAETAICATIPPCDKRTKQFVTLLAKKEGTIPLDEQVSMALSSEGVATDALEDVRDATEDCTRNIMEGMPFQPLRRPCYLIHPGAAIGLDDGEIVARYDGKRVGHIPLGHVGLLAVQGGGSISVPLMYACAANGIPVIFCTAQGRFKSMVAPDSPVFRMRGDAQLRLWDRLGPLGRNNIAACIVTAKIANHVKRFGTDALQRAGLDALTRLASSLSDAEILGTEGSFAVRCFRVMNGMIDNQDFRSSKREPRRRADRWNCLLDTASNLVYSRLVMLLLGEGLSPYRGFLHRQHTRYATLATDMQEIFRDRMVAVLIVMVNAGEVRSEHFERTAGKWGMTLEGRKLMNRLMEKAFRTRLPTEPEDWLSIMEEQIRRLRLWCTGKEPLTLWREGQWWQPSNPVCGMPQTV